MDNSADTRGEEAVKHAAVLASISAVHERQNSPIRERQPAANISRVAVLARLRVRGSVKLYFEFSSQLAQGREQLADGGRRAVGDAGQRP